MFSEPACVKYSAKAWTALEESDSMPKSYRNRDTMLLGRTILTPIVAGTIQEIWMASEAALGDRPPGFEHANSKSATGAIRAGAAGFDFRRAGAC